MKNKGTRPKHKHKRKNVKNQKKMEDKKYCLQKEKIISGNQINIFELLEFLWETIERSNFRIVDIGEEEEGKINLESSFNEVASGEEIKKKFKGESHQIVKLLYSLEDNPKKGKFLGNVSGTSIKELKYKSFRFYFIADGYKIKVMSEEELSDLLLKFVRMSDKKTQQKTIDEIRQILIKIGPYGFK